MDIAPYLDRIYAWNPALIGRPTRVDPYGLNNLVVIAGDEWVCRFPRTGESRQRLNEEAALLAVVSRYVNIRVPEFTVKAALDFVAYRLLPGRPLYRHDLLRLPAGAQNRFAADLAAFLHDLHTIPASALAEAIPPAPQPPRSPAPWREHLASLRTTLYPHLWADQHAAIEDLFAPVLDGRLDMTYPPALIHNDLAAYHLLADTMTGKLSGVLDFGEAGWGDPAADYALLINTYGESFLRRMMAADPAIAAHLERARFRAAYLELEWALKGVQTGDPNWYLVHVGRARDSRPFGVAYVLG